ncbi:hypothetical protein BH11BAC3_BH11BAC3_09970 [soil metagenome]
MAKKGYSALKVKNINKAKATFGGFMLHIG